MTTLAIETGIEEEYEQALIASARKAGWDVAVVQHIPFTNKFCWSDRNGLPGREIPESLRANTDVWFHGSIQGAKAAQNGTPWAVHAPWSALRCSNYYPLLKDRLFQKNPVFTTVGNLPEEKDALYASDLAVDGTLFFRPDANDKIFTGGCISLDEFDQGYKLMTFYDPPPETPIVVASPQKILAEARFLVVGGVVVTGSYYKTGRQSLRLLADGYLMGLASDTLKFCQAQGYYPAKSWVLDLAQNDSGWHIIEVGATSCCGLYKCDLDAFVAALAKVL